MFEFDFFFSQVVASSSELRQASVGRAFVCANELRHCRCPHAHCQHVARHATSMTLDENSAVISKHCAEHTGRASPIPAFHARLGFATA